MTILMTSNGYTVSVAINDAAAPNNPWKWTLYTSTINNNKKLVKFITNNVYYVWRAILINF